MTFGKRLKVIRRAVMCMPPGFFAELIGLTRDELESIEDDRLIPSDEVLEKLTVITKTTRGWFVDGIEAATVNNWGYFELPWPEIHVLGDMQHIAVAEIEETLRTDFTEALREIDSPAFGVAKVRGEPWRFVVIPLGSNGAVIFKTGDVLWGAMKYALETAGAEMGREIQVSQTFAEKVGSPRQRRTDPDTVVKLFKLLGFTKLANRWRIDPEKIRQCVWKKDSGSYQKMVREAARLIALRGFGEEVKKGASTYTRDELEKLRPLAWKKELGID